MNSATGTALAAAAETIGTPRAQNSGVVRCRTEPAATRTARNRGMGQEGGIEDGRAPAREQHVDVAQHIGVLGEPLSREGRTPQVHESFDFG